MSRSVEYHITQYDLEQGALEIQYIEEYFGEFPRKKTAVEIVRRALEDPLCPRDEAVHLHARAEVRREVVRREGLRRRLEPWKRVSGKNRLGLRRRARAAASQSEENQCEKSPAHRLTLDSKPSER